MARISSDDLVAVISATLGCTVSADDVRVIGERLIAAAPLETTPDAALERALLGSVVTSVADGMDAAGESFASSTGRQYIPGPSSLRA